MPGPRRRWQLPLARPITRRELLRSGGAALALTAARCLVPLSLTGCRREAEAVPVRVGILHSQTGTMAIGEASLRDAEMLAIDEINAAGGVLGRLIEAVVEDPRSRPDLFVRKARKLLQKDQVAAVFGCWTSTSRKAVLPLFEVHNGLLFYPLQYEGNECSRNVIYAGSAPNQQILPAIDWLLSPAGGSRQRFYLLGSDYLFPWTANVIITRHLAGRQGRQVVGKRYTPLGQRDFQAIVQDIRKADPDVIVSTVNGDSNIYFFNELAAQGITAGDIPVVSTSVGEDELRGILPPHVVGHLSAWSYFQSIDTLRNKEFVGRFQAEHGEDRVLDDPMEAAYSQVFLWKLAVEKAGSFAVDRILEAFSDGIEFEAPGGRIRVDPKTHHSFKRFRMGRVREDRQFDIIYESQDWIAPDPYPTVVFPGWSCDWTRQGITQGPDVWIGR